MHYCMMVIRSQLWKCTKLELCNYKVYVKLGVQGRVQIVGPLLKFDGFLLMHGLNSTVMEHRVFNKDTLMVELLFEMGLGLW